MTQETIIYLAREAFCGVACCCTHAWSWHAGGNHSSILQATTQIQEQTLTFVPKLLQLWSQFLYLDHGC